MSLSGATTGSVLAPGLPSFYSVPTVAVRARRARSSKPSGRRPRHRRHRLPGHVHVGDRARQSRWPSPADHGPEHAGAGRRLPGSQLGPRHQRHGRQCAPSLAAHRSRALDRTSFSTRAGRSRPATTRVRGPPGRCRTWSGVSAARNTIDIVRAARDLPAAHASTELHGLGSLRGRPDGDVRPEHRRLLRPRAAPEGRGGRGATLPVQAHLRLPDRRARTGTTCSWRRAASTSPTATPSPPCPRCITPPGQPAARSRHRVARTTWPRSSTSTTLASIAKATPSPFPAGRRCCRRMIPRTSPRPSTAPLLIIQGGPTSRSR